MEVSPCINLKNNNWTVTANSELICFAYLKDSREGIYNTSQRSKRIALQKFKISKF